MTKNSKQNREILSDNNFSNTPRKLFVFRHAERVDVTFKSENTHWLDLILDETGNFQHIDLNLPHELPKRKGGYKSYADDTPLTELGYFHAILTGRALAKNGVEIHDIYTSPVLRCIQTANGILEGLNNPGLKINVEIGLFEWTKFCKHFNTHEWMTHDDLISANYYVNPYYKSIYSKNMLKLNETVDDWYNRSYDVTQKILNNSQGDVLMVGHRGSLYSCTNQLCGLSIPEEKETEKVSKVRYLDGIHVEEHEEGKFKYAKLPIPRFTSNFSH